MDPRPVLRPSTLKPVAALSASLLVLAACGGGGDGGNAAAPTPVVASQLVITEANQQTVAAESLEVAQQGSSVADLGAALATGAQVSTGAGAPGPVVLAGVASKLIALVPRQPALATGVTQSDTENCSGGGSIALTATTAGTTNGVAAGDSITATANNCVETIDGVTRRLNGRLALSVSAGSFDPFSLTYPKDVTLHLTATSLTLDTVALDGALDLHLVQASSSAASVSVSATAFSWKSSGTSGTRTLTLKNYTQRIEQNTVDTARITVTGTVESDNANYGGGTVSYDIATVQPVVVNTLNSGLLVSGALKVTGKGSALLMTVTDGNQLQLQVDTNGDGTYDTTRSVSRFALVP